MNTDCRGCTNSFYTTLFGRNYEINTKNCRDCVQNRINNSQK
jgi:hypothetical protein